MAIRYLLNETIEFIPDTRLLRSLKPNSPPVSLNGPSSRCLELLLERRYELVTHQQFYDEVWGDEGRNVPANTLYQNIALLRKALKLAGNESDEMIITLSRKGFMFNEAFSVIESTVEHIDGEQIQTPIEEDIAPVTTSFSEVNALSVDPSVSVATMSMPTAEPLDSSHKKMLTQLFIILIVLLLSALLGWYLSISTLFSVSPYFDKYTTVRTQGECTVYSEKGASSPPSTEIKIPDNINCKETPYLYARHSRFSVTGSIIACESPFAKNSAPLCVAYFTVESNKND
ncbi:MAG TPA: winged helix-turn-helix domain-containing protein [Scandinavium sp.]|jgi:DNA-binding winged helix-turn-helix (wHTH) protein